METSSNGQFQQVFILENLKVYNLFPLLPHLPPWEKKKKTYVYTFINGAHLLKGKPYIVYCIMEYDDQQAHNSHHD